MEKALKSLGLLGTAINHLPLTNTEKEFINAIVANDMPAVEELLKRGVAREVQNISILSLATFCRHVDMVKYLISIGCEIMKCDKIFGSVLKCAIWSHSVIGPYNERGEFPVSRNGDICSSDEHRLDLVKILVEALSPEDAFGAIFLDNSGSLRMTPFQYACFCSCDEMIIYFLSFLPPVRDIPLENLKSPVGGTVFHDVFTRSITLVFDNAERAQHERPTEETKRSRLKTITTMMEKLSHGKELINRPSASAFDSNVPLGIYFSKLEKDLIRNVIDLSMLMELVEILGKNGVCLDTRIDSGSGLSFLKIAVRCQLPDLVEALLRAGCSMYDIPDISSRGNPVMSRTRGVIPQSGTNGSSVLKEALGFGAGAQPRKHHPPSFRRIIELLLAFGLDLSREKHLDDFEDLYSSIPLSKLQISGDDQPKFDMMIKLQKLRRSGEMVSLKRLCRQVVRRQLKPNADELIEQMTCIPPNMKRYLQVFNEPNLLGVE